METIGNFRFFPIQFDRKGKDTGGLPELLAHLPQVTDLVILCHGFRNDENDAHALYKEFLTNLSPQLSDPRLNGRLQGRTFAAAGAMWPSMIFPEPDDSGNAQSADPTGTQELQLKALRATLPVKQRPFIDRILKYLPAARAGNEVAQNRMSRELLELAKLQGSLQQEFSDALNSPKPELLRESFANGDRSLLLGEVAPGTGGAAVVTGADPANAPSGGAQSFFGKVFGFVPKFLNLTTFLLMFERCGTIGEKGLSKIAREAHAKNPNLRIHLVGHSLGGRAVTACAKALLKSPALKADSLMLLQAAYSHYGLSPDGHFRDVIAKQAVKQPIVATHSDHDSVVGFAYTSMAALSLNNSRAIGDANSPFGGIGRNGVLKTPEATNGELKTSTDAAAYAFQAGKLHNLNGSRAVNNIHLIRDHGDVRNPHVTWAFANLLAMS